MKVKIIVCIVGFGVALLALIYNQMGWVIGGLAIGAFSLFIPTERKNGLHR